uniref:Gamma-glutamyltranspeptidase 1 n=1 Tax=Syphacia muris TaxID=451379 RepID=A0A0N5ATI5_9BILA
MLYINLLRITYFVCLIFYSTWKIHKVIVIIGIAVLAFFLFLTILLSILFFNSYHQEVTKKAYNNFDLIISYSLYSDVLIEGGNAVDAAIAVLICLGVVNPMSSGLGGGHFMTIYNASTGRCTAIDAREVAPYRASKDMFDKNPKEAQKGWKAIGVPGELHGLRTAYERFGGNVSWKRLFQPSIRMLNIGVPVSQALGATLKVNFKVLKSSILLALILDSQKFKDVYKFGDIISNTLKFHYSDTLGYLADAADPIQEFYNGQMTDLFLAEFEENGGIMTRDDFRNYSSIVHEQEDIIVTELKNYTMYGPPPPSSSAVTQNFTFITSNTKFYKFAYAQRNRLGDSAFVKDALQIARNITSDKFVEMIKQKITRTPHPLNYYTNMYQPLMDKGTTNVAIIDQDGNAVAVTTTVNLFFGSQVASESTGIIWNSQMDDFSQPNGTNYYGYPPSPVNFIEPRKRPLSSISPLIILNKGTKKVEMVIGCAGGSQIISTVSSIVSKVLLLGWDLKTAFDSPRIHNQLLPQGTVYEEKFPETYIRKLQKRGHNLTTILGIGEATGIYNHNGRIYAMSDFRKGVDSYPAGF